MFRNCVAMEKDHEQVNYIKMRIQGIWDCPDQDQEVGAKDINENERFQMTLREPMEPIDEEVGDLVDLEDVPDSEHMHSSAEQTIDAIEDHLEQSIHVQKSPCCLTCL